MFALLRDFRERRFTKLTDADAPAGDEEVALLEGDPGCVPTHTGVSPSRTGSHWFIALSHRFALVYRPLALAHTG